MKISFSTLACPDWTHAQIVAIASTAGYDGIELRFVENEDSLWKLPAFSGDRNCRPRNGLYRSRPRISCVDTSCRFHFPDPKERERWLEEGERMADLAAALEAPRASECSATRFSRAPTRVIDSHWIADRFGASRTRLPTGVEVWLETHGDFAGAARNGSDSFRGRLPQKRAHFGIRRTVTSSRRSGRKKARLGLALPFGTCTLKTCSSSRMAGRPRLRAKEISLCRKFKLRCARSTTGASFRLSGRRNGIRKSPDASVALPHFARWWRENADAMSDDAAILRKLATADIPGAMALSDQAGWNQTADDWRMLIELSPQGCLAIEIDGEMASTTTLTVLWDNVSHGSEWF